MSHNRGSWAHCTPPSTLLLPTFLFSHGSWGHSLISFEAQLPHVRRGWKIFHTYLKVAWGSQVDSWQYLDILRLLLHVHHGHSGPEWTSTYLHTVHPLEACHDIVVDEPQLSSNVWFHAGNQFWKESSPIYIYRRILNPHLFWLNSHPFFARLFARLIICRLNLSVSAPPPWCLDEKLLIKLWYIWEKIV